MTMIASNIYLLVTAKRMTDIISVTKSKNVVSGKGNKNFNNLWKSGIKI